jgi:O-antigen biosynthesis protein WbqP
LLKRAFDICLAVPGLIVSSVPLLILIIVIRLDSPGPGVFRQVRVGRNGTPFTCYKLRTMTEGTADRPSHEMGTSAITRLGHFLRRTKLDELPQLWNIVLGQMSFVGPRPCLPSQIELVELRRANGVLSLRPGITGVAQVQGIDMSDPARLAALDAEYISHVSLRTDLDLVWKTVSGAGRGDAAGGS